MKVQLSYDREWDKWMLREYGNANHITPEDASYAMGVDHQAGEYRYRFYKFENGDWYECVTRPQFELHKMGIEENEGPEILKIWEQYQDQYLIVKDDHRVFKLRDRLQAMLTLELFDLQITMKQWPHKPLSTEAEDLIAKERERIMQEESKAMAEADENVRMGEAYHESMGGDPTEGKEPPTAA